jgi:hypothetical protein
MTKWLWVFSASTVVIALGATSSPRIATAEELCPEDPCSTVPACETSCNRCLGLGANKHCYYVVE